jgi:hypothetical protein
VGGLNLYACSPNASEQSVPYGLRAASAVTLLAAEGDQALRALACTAGMLNPTRPLRFDRFLSGRPFTGEQQHPQPVSRDQTSRPDPPPSARDRPAPTVRLSTVASQSAGRVRGGGTGRTPGPRVRGHRRGPGGARTVRRSACPHRVRGLRDLGSTGGRTALERLGDVGIPCCRLRPAMRRRQVHDSGRRPHSGARLRSSGSAGWPSSCPSRS